MRQNLLRDTTFRTLVVGSAAITAVWTTNDDEGGCSRASQRNRLCSSHRAKTTVDARPSTRLIPSFLSPRVALTEAALGNVAFGVEEHASAARRKQKDTTQALKPKHVYDFIVIGYGNAGRSAVATLQKQCPTASIALLDPLRRPDQVGKHSNQVDYVRARAIGLSPREQTVHVDGCDDLSYRYAVLVATGARGAPPPSYLMDEKALPSILELRSTVLPSLMDASSSDDREHVQQQRPILSAEAVRREVLQRANAGASVGVLGCGWDAVDLVVAASTRLHTKQRPVIMFGSHGPLSHILPNYLSAAVSKRLQAKRITVLDRSLIRYISYEDNQKGSGTSLQQQQLQVYTAKSFDFLDGQALKMDLLVIAPEVHGPRGTGTLPTDEIPDFLEETAKGRSWYQTWSSITVASPNDPSLIVCYKDDGRIAVNTELCACQGVYAAGAVAKCANGLTGHAVVAGAGVEDGRAAGHVVAMNMARHYNGTANGGLFGFGDRDGRTVTTLVKNPLPVWRSDLRSSAGTSEDQVSSLADIGIVALCVGNCDSESLSTHGVWWTNQAAQRRLLGLLDDDSDDLGRQQQQRKRTKQALKPVYGLGVVYYLDRMGRIQGVMTWGLPFHRSHKLNNRLVEQMKNVIKTNGGFRSLETELDHINMSQYMVGASKTMVATAFASPSGDDDVHQLDGALENFPRPLHRFTEVRPPSVRSVGVLKRKDGHGHGILGEDLFVRYEDDDIQDAPVSKPHPTGNVGSATARVEARYEWDVWQQKERRWDDNENRARPPKEEPLWIRKGDEMRNTPQRDRIAAAYNNALNTKPYGR
jgi:hypothetical protein